MCVFSKFRFCFCDLDLDLDPMTVTYEFDLDVLKTYLRAKNEAFTSVLSKVRARTRTDRQTDSTERITTPHSRVAPNKFVLCLK